MPFVYTFHFDSSTDLTGFTAVDATGPSVPPGLAYGSLAGFTDTFSPLMQDLVLTTPHTAAGASIGNLSSDGGIIVEYDYTPAAPVPEPGSLLLLGTGALGLLGMIRRKLRA
jgi:hypothetical protein